ncbi:MAG: polysaccharide biosynthesis protein [Mucilaginibacter sp.]|nr:polysaccharide biosynthesis protein [Mucilaginibacter sp.]
MKRKLVNNLSANTLQLIINQLFGLIIFYILSTSLDKNSFGQINLALALLLAIFNILSFGIDQIAVRKIASGEKPGPVLSLYISHVLLTGLAFYGLLLFGRGLFSPAINSYNLVLLIGAGKLMIYFSTPFKQSAIGMERFRLLAWMSVISNVARACALIALSLMHIITLRSVIIVFISGDLLELVIGLFLFKRYTGLPLSFKWSKSTYISLLKESFPQFGVVIITSALARFDWIFIGVIVSAVSLAEYSFAYKVFELSTLPLLAIAPLLIPWFTRIFKTGVPNIVKLKLLARLEMIIAAFTIVIINICWTPVIDRITAGKYGAVNERTIFILTLCIPLLYLTNFLWTISFAKGRLKMIFTAFVITLSVNVAVDIILIPLYKNEGAAIGYLAGYLAQTVYFIIKNDVKELNKALYPLIICMGCACLSIFLAKMIFANVLEAVLFSILFYLFLLMITMQVRLRDCKDLREVVDW